MSVRSGRAAAGPGVRAGSRWGSDRSVAAAIFLAALAVRAAAVLALHNFGTVDGFEAEEIAVNMLSGRGFSMALFWGPTQLTSYNYPLYTYFIYLHFLVFGVRDYLGVELSQAVIGAGSCGLVFYLGRAMLDRRVGVAAGLGCAFYPTYVYWTTRAQALTIEVFLLIALLLIILRAMEKDGFGYWAAAGLISGLAVLSKTLYLVFLPGIFVWAALMGGSRRDWLRLLPRAAVFGLCAAAVVAPWTARNYLVFDKFILVNSNSGFNLWIGNNPAATGSLFAADHRNMIAKVPEQMRRRLAAASDTDKDPIFAEAARAYIREHPGRMLELVPARMAALWWFDPYMPSDYPFFRQLVYLCLLVPALAGMVITIRQWRRLSIFYYMYLVTSLVYMPYYGSARFRYLIEFSFIVLGAAFAVTAGRWWMGRRSDPGPGPEQIEEAKT